MALIVAVAVVFVAVATWKYAVPLKRGPIDLHVYVGGGTTFADRGDLYGSHFTVAHLPFTYPPFAALVFAGVSWIRFSLLNRGLVVVNVAALAAVAWLCLGMVGRPRTRLRLVAALLLTSVAVWTEPVQQTLEFGQVNIVLMLLVIADLAMPEESRFRGIGIGLAAGFKLIPAVFIPYLLITRQWRTAAISVAAFLATIVIAFVIHPHDAIRYFGGVIFDSSRVGTVAYVGNQSLHGMIYRAMDGASAAQPVWVLVAGAVGVVTLLTARAAYVRGAVLSSITLVGLAGLLISPISWSHHWVWVMPALVLLTDWAWRRGRVTARGTSALYAVLVALPVAVFLFPWPAGLGPDHMLKGLIWQVPDTPVGTVRWTMPQWFVGEAYTLIGLIVVAAAAVHYLRQATSSRPVTSLSGTNAG